MAVNPVDITQHIPLVHYVIRRGAFVPPRGWDYEDLVQEGVIGLLHAARKYRPERGAFSTLACLCIYRAISVAMRPSRRDALSQSVSLDHTLSSVAEESATGHIILEDPKAWQQVDARLLLHDALALDRELVTARVNGRTQLQVAKRLKSSQVAISRRLARLKKRLLVS